MATPLHRRVAQAATRSWRKPVLPLHLTTLPRSVDAPPLDEVRTQATVEAKRPTIAITFQQL